MLEDPEVKEEKRTIRNSHSNLEIIFGNVLSIIEKETKGGTIKLFYLIMKADKYFQFYKLHVFPFRIIQYSLIYLLKC